MREPVGCALPTVTGDEQTRYLCAAGVNAQQTVSRDETQYLHGDLIDSTMLTTDEGGTAVSAVSYTAFGELLGSAPANTPRYGYAGAWGYQDDRLGIPDWTGPRALHVGARWYDPSLGRFLARDPIGIFGGPNVYAYCRGRPGLVVDPTGRFSYGQMLAVVTIGAALGGLSNSMQSGSFDWGDFAAGATGGAVAGGLGVVHPALGGAAGNFVTGLLSGDSLGTLAAETVLGAIPAFIGSFVGVGFSPIEAAFWDIDVTTGTNICRQGW